MAEVWLARHEILGRDVAVKVLFATTMNQGDASWLEFIDSARIAAAQTHPGLNKVLHADVANGLPYLVLEYLDGPTLQDLLAQSGPPDLATARTIVEAVCGAVSELHQHDLVHRDLKPSNIMLTADGQVVVTDFGLARAMAAAALRSNTGGVAGTPAYMAPEMFDGVASTRTDVYAIGLTAYQLLCGRRGFSGTFDEVKRQHQSVPLDLEPLRAVHVPEAVIDVIARATSKDVLFRPKSARHLLDAFRAAFDAAEIARATSQRIAALIARRKIPPATVAPTAPAISTGAWQESLATLAGKRRDGRAGPQPITSTVEPSTPPVDPDFLLRKRADRWRARIAVAVTSLLGAIGGLVMLGLCSRLIVLWERWVHKHMGYAPIVRTRAGFVIVPFLLFTIATLSLSLLIYRLVRGRRVPQASEKTECGWCGHELRGIMTPICSECGHRIGDQGRDEQGQLPPALRWRHRLPALLLLYFYFFLAWAVVEVCAVQLTSSFILAGRVVLTFLCSVLALIIPLALMLGRYEIIAQRALSRSGLAWCRKCRNELRNLGDPVCPQCGERI